MAGRGVAMLTVVIPVHGVAADLPACLDSVLADPTAEVEVVAIDDCSPDSSGDILDDYARRDPRLRVVHLSTNVGLGPARNTGLQHARGEYVWFVDGDDLLPAGALRAVVDRLTTTRPDVLIVDHVERFDDGRTVAGTPAGSLAGPCGPLADRPHLLHLAQSACTKVVRRGLLETTGLRFATGWYEDCAYTHPLLLSAERIDTLDRVCYLYRKRTAAGGITGTRSARHFEVFEQYQRLFTVVDTMTPAHERFRGDLFRIMIDHLLVILGNDRRLPPTLRREFFRRIAADYRRWLPADGYPVPGGAPGLKHRLVRHNAYWAYLALRTAYRMVGRLRRGERPGPAQPAVALPTQRSATTHRSTAAPAPVQVRRR
ncbi:MAG TPA: glycosyltransferase family 2 protein [Actinoplanes sp.]|nr:glycosyltransferase family 2 protein [Actinoplanes sp.]